MAPENSHDCVQRPVSFTSKKASCGSGLDPEALTRNKERPLSFLQVFVAAGQSPSETRHALDLQLKLRTIRAESPTLQLLANLSTCLGALLPPSACY